MILLQGKGKLIYDPPRPGFKKLKDNWSILTVNPELTRYYRWWMKFEKHVDLCEPSWGSHISVTRSPKLPKDKQALWKKYQGEIVDYEYSNIIKKAKDSKNPGHFYFIEVWSKRLDEIRNELGLPYHPKYHITIGRNYYD